MTHVAVVGAGMVGLASALNLADAGYDVTVLDRRGVAAGASWGNAGFVCPSMTFPLSAPGEWKNGFDAVTNKDAPLALPQPFNPKLWKFLTTFALQMTETKFKRAVDELAPDLKDSIASFERLKDFGVEGKFNHSDFTVGLGSEAELNHFIEETGINRDAGVPSVVETFDPREKPYFTDLVTHGAIVKDQAYIDPPAFVQSIADAAEKLGVKIVTDAEIVTGHVGADGVGLVDAQGRSYSFDGVVIAAGVWSDELLHKLHGKQATIGMAAGRGYSFTAQVDPEYLPTTPVYLPTTRVVFTPYRGGVRVGGTMEFLDPDAPLRPERIESMKRVASKYMKGIDLENTTDHWVGPRPVSPTGPPKIEALSPRSFVAAGHGMWGIAHGPRAGEQIAQIVKRTLK